MVLHGMRHRAAQASLTALIAPIRPTLKWLYPKKHLVKSDYANDMKMEPGVRLC